MGYLKEKHGMMMIGRVPEGTCPECAVAHDPAQPHNKDSLAYQYKFYDEHGQAAHCDQCVREGKSLFVQQLL